MKNPPIKAVLFDLDDTLWSIMPVIARAEIVLHDWLAVHAPAVAERFSIDILRQQRLKLMAVDPRYQIDLAALRHAALCRAFASAGEDVAKVDHAMAVFSAARNAVTPFDDVHPVLMHLRQQVLLGAITNGTADLRVIGLEHYFQASLSAPRLGCAKPGAAIFHLACDALDVAPAQALYVGDDPRLDIEGAQRAGLQTMWINRFGRELPPHIVPDGHCTDLYQLQHWLAPRMALAAVAADR
ncbi:MAG TPA: HAD family hydrolase [Burkholderiaceae bacterium]|nr:HAD family hydrolase [Burkholderiaceae bacterium]